jgi:glycosyltransferase involved in cell wall biosynthesis
MKVLYIGCYRDGTGWAHAAQGYILSLDTAGVDVVPRFVKLNSREGAVSRRVEKLEKKSDKGCDFVIQHVLPHQMDFNGEFEKNIALYVTETSHCKNTNWPEQINFMDEAWVPNKYMAESFAKNSNISTPHRIVPHAFDMSKYQQEYEKTKIPELQDKFVFYYIGEINRRKNIATLLKAYHLEFGINEDVGIVLKAHIPGANISESENALQRLSDEVKKGLKLYGSGDHYNEEIFICDYLKEEQIMSLHGSFDCFVSATLGEAWGIPIFDAMAMGKTPICTDTGGPADFIDGGGYLVESRKEPCFGMLETFDELYVGNEYWDAPNINELRKCMREAYENKEDRNKRAIKGVSNSYSYGHLTVGSMMRDFLAEESPKHNTEITEKHKTPSI